MEGLEPRSQQDWERKAAYMTERAEARRARDAARLWPTAGELGIAVLLAAGFAAVLAAIQVLG